MTISSSGGLRVRGKCFCGHG
uniref:Uncharacterized protein n=1 Tax=Anguilla anguilla TaxID=7936 RepID=A0A0E9SPH5_ANGAN